MKEPPTPIHGTDIKSGMLGLISSAPVILEKILTAADQLYILQDQIHC